MKNKLPDWAVRSAKTFVQVFLATLIPAVVAAMGNAPSEWSEVGKWLASIFTPNLVISDALATAICAVWNALLEKKSASDYI